MKLRISHIALLVLIISLLCASCGSTSVPKEHYAAITLEDGTHGTLWLHAEASTDYLYAGEKIFVRSTATAYEASKHPNMYFLVINAENDSAGTLRGYTVYKLDQETVKIFKGALAIPATIDSLFLM